MENSASMSASVRESFCVAQIEMRLRRGILQARFMACFRHPRAIRSALASLRALHGCLIYATYYVAQPDA